MNIPQQAKRFTRSRKDAKLRKGLLRLDRDDVRADPVANAPGTDTALSTIVSERGASRPDQDEIVFAARQYRFESVSPLRGSE